MNPAWIQQIKGVMQQMQYATNPQLALNQFMMSNPQLANAISFIQQNGGNPQTAFYNLAKQMNVNPETVLNALK